MVLKMTIHEGVAYKWVAVNEKEERKKAIKELYESYLKYFYSTVKHDNQWK